MALKNVGCFLRLTSTLHSWLDVTGSWPSSTFASRGVRCIHVTENNLYNNINFTLLPGNEQ